MGKKAVSKLFYYTSVALTFALAGVTITGAFAGHVPPESSTLIPFIGLLLSGLLLINLAAAIYWGIRRRFWIVIPLIAIAANWQYLGRIFQPPFPAEKGNGRTLKIATYNVDSFGNEQSGYSCKEIAKYMEEHQVHIVCLQEFAANRYFTADSIRNTFANWQYVIIPQAPDSISILQIALFSKYPVKDSKLITYPDSRNCSMWCDLDVDGQTVRVFNNHLQTTEVSQNKRRLERELAKNELTGREEAVARQLLEGLNENFRKRAAQAKTLEQLIRTTPYPILVCGDFNSLPSSYTYSTVKGDNLQDGFQTCGHGYMYTFRYFKRLLRIDYIFHSKEFKGVDYYSPDLDLCSDHNPVVMEVKM